MLRHYSRDLMLLMDLLQLLGSESLNPFLRKGIAAESHRIKPAPERR